MPVVERLSRNMIEKFLNSSDYGYLRDKDGDFVIQLGHVDRWGCGLYMCLSVTGSRGDVLSLIALPDWRVASDQWVKAILACNEWNIDNSVPKAALKTGHPTNTTGTFILRQSLDTEKGVHQELVSDFISVFLVSVVQFMEWAHNSKGF